MYINFFFRFVEMFYNIVDCISNVFLYFWDMYFYNEIKLKKIMIVLIFFVLLLSLKY